eukprot:2674020-Pyramimonas_sp.AAC.5
MEYATNTFAFLLLPLRQLRVVSYPYQYHQESKDSWYHHVLYCFSPQAPEGWSRPITVMGYESRPITVMGYGLSVADNGGSFLLETATWSKVPWYIRFRILHISARLAL